MAYTRLQLAQQLRQEARINGTGPTTTLSQTGEYKKCVDWNDYAYNDIQNEYETWKFLRKEFTASLTSGTSEYTPTAAGVTNHKKWITDDTRCYLTADGVATEQEIFYVPWDEFKRSYLFGSARSQTGRPVQYSIKPDNSIVFWPIPDDTYTVIGEYCRTNYVMTANSDVPAFPADFHLVVMWRALVFYGNDYVDESKLYQATDEYKKLMSKLRFDQLPRIGWGCPLA